MTAVAVLLASGAFVVVAGPATAAETLPAGFSVTAEPTGSGPVVEVAHAPDGRRFVAQKNGVVKTLHPNGTVTELLDLRDKVNGYSDRGLLGLAVDNEFATNGWLYVLFSQELNPSSPDGKGPMTSALTRVTVRPNSTVADPTSPGTYILGSQGQQPCPTPTNDLDCMPSDHYWHSIGTVRVDPADGTLWVGSGDAHVVAGDSTSFRPYDPTNTAGKILHIDKNGRGLANHPFCAGETNLALTCTKVYAMGFRNPFRSAARPGKGPVVGDVGQSAFEEVDLLQPGHNYGWPCYEANARNNILASTPTCQAMYAKEGTAEAATPPAWSYGHTDGGAVIAGHVYRGTAYPADMRGDIFVADYVQGWVKRLEVDATDRVTAAHDFSTGWTGVSLFEAPDLNIGYVDMGWSGATAGVYTYRYGGATNAAPTAAASATPSSGAAPLTVTFSSAGSSDPEGQALTYEWNFGDGSPNATTDSPQHVYAVNGNYTVTLTVRDPQGASGTATTTVVVGSNTAPTVSIDAPAEGFLYTDGVPVELRGSASDAQDGALPGSSLSWQILLRHGTHLHQNSAPTGATATFTPVTDHDADSSYEIKLTATDSAGASTTVTRTISPRTVQLTLASSPAGVPLSYEGVAAPAPSTRTSAVGFRATIGAPATYESGGVTYEFRSWSDGGAAQHAIDVPGSSTTLTAQYAVAGSVPTETLTFGASADTYVDAGTPTTSRATSSNLRADATPETFALTRFDVAGLAGRTVTKVVLRGYEKDSSNSGGRVRSVTGAWSEATLWGNRPTLGGVLATLDQPVTAGNWYEIELPTSVVTADGAVDLGLDSLSGDAHVWASRHTTTPPQLIVTVTGELPPPPAVETLSFGPTADTYVASQAPTTSYGTTSSLVADASPENTSLTRFVVTGLAGRTVTKVVLRGYEKGNSDSGGRVRSITGAWSETTTWDTRPTLGGVLATLDGPVSSGTWYEIELPVTVVGGDGEVDLALDTLSGDSHAWASRHTSTPPQLLVTVGEGGGGGAENAAPSVSIDAPTAGFLYTNGTRVDLAGSANDAEDGALSGAALSWQVLLRDSTGVRQVSTSAGATSSFVPATDQDAGSSYEIKLTATDSAGASTTVTRTISPRTVQLTLASSPAGVPLSYEGVAAPAPSTRASAVGFRASVEAPLTHVTDGVTYRFSSWSDGGAARHTIDVPGTATTLTATYTADETPPPPPGPSETLTFGASADTYVDAGTPTTSRATSSNLRADATPETFALTRFDVAGLAGRTVTKVVLRGYEKDSSNSGGRVRSVTGAWSEATLWGNRPTLGGVLATLDQPVTAGNWYEIELPTSVVTADGAVDLGLDSLSGDAHVWASRHTTTPPQLIVTVTGELPPPPAVETLSFGPTADTYVASQAPTTSYGTTSSLVADASPENTSLTRFVVTGLAGRTVTKVVLRGYEKGNSDSGGRVRSITGAWSETTTWDTRPTLGGVLATLDGPVSSGTWYEIELPVTVVGGDGEVDLALDTLSGDSHAWASRHTSTPPQLVVTVGT